MAGPTILLQARTMRSIVVVAKVLMVVPLPEVRFVHPSSKLEILKRGKLMERGSRNWDLRRPDIVRDRDG